MSMARCDDGAALLQLMDAMPGRWNTIAAARRVSLPELLRLRARLLDDAAAAARLPLPAPTWDAVRLAAPRRRAERRVAVYAVCAARCGPHHDLPADVLGVILAYALPARDFGPSPLDAPSSSGASDGGFEVERRAPRKRPLAALAAHYASSGGDDASQQPRRRKRRRKKKKKAE